MAETFTNKGALLNKILVTIAHSTAIEEKDKILLIDYATTNSRGVVPEYAYMLTELVFMASDYRDHAVAWSMIVARKKITVVPTNPDAPLPPIPFLSAEEILERIVKASSQ